ncbi:MAG: 2-oxoacid:acceptor oxidoreductase family protein [Deltaproteobacteria bacterium]|nr:2-oxoacid:acceptor oxidoreductase family protein [Candidatus Anaeroferrophillacea bacterium]
MIEVRIHGRGGQGAVIASQILSYACFLAGRYAQSFPTFGAERRGAPVAAFVRLDDRPIDLRSPVAHPDCVAVMAARLAETVAVTAGIAPGGLVLINSDQPATHYDFFEEDCRVVTLNIGAVALAHGLGSVTMPLINAPLLGAFARLTGMVPLERLVEALPRFIPAKLGANEAALREAWAAGAKLVR